MATLLSWAKKKNFHILAAYPMKSQFNLLSHKKNLDFKTPRSETKESLQNCLRLSYEKGSATL